MRCQSVARAEGTSLGHGGRGINGGVLLSNSKGIKDLILKKKCNVKVGKDG